MDSCIVDPYFVITVFLCFGNVFTYLIILCVFVYMSVYGYEHVCHGTYVEARGQLAGVSSLLLYVSWGSNFDWHVSGKCLSLLSHYWGPLIIASKNMWYYITQPLFCLVAKLLFLNSIFTVNMLGIFAIIIVNIVFVI